MPVNVLASAMEGMLLNIDLVNGSACPRPGLLSPGQDTKTCSTPNAQPYPNIHLVASKTTSKHASSSQLTLFTLSAVCILPILTAAAPTRVSRGSHQPPSAIPISGALRVYPLQIRDSQDRSRSRLAAEIKGQVIVAPVDPSQGRLCLPCHSSPPPATTTAPTRWPMLAISLPAPTVPGQFPSCCP